MSIEPPLTHISHILLELLNAPPKLILPLCLLQVKSNTVIAGKYVTRMTHGKRVSDDKRGKGAGEQFVFFLIFL